LLLMPVSSMAGAVMRSPFLYRMVKKLARAFRLANVPFAFAPAKSRLFLLNLSISGSLGRAA
ncbi:MAG: hypothetical protein KDJ74_09840, partial [Notoacmeibacter sp.]|nr:hypothetical protein [Notoacmeibacter sp.]